MYTQVTVLNTGYGHHQSVNKTDELDMMMNISNEELSLFLLEHYDDGNFAQAHKHYKKQHSGI
ncbi:hypothetical protein [Photobacterium andalusiense]|uniref:Uncharacterized protein n=1 Tax=Photobacterium andalusiense TaxID=2204296 RepID=A0A1Y6MHV1_9GAMM|nr:hypothetical protein [Photobacterium andalusiense]SMY35360.1 hypothetical protein PAND9192_02033 [Photobacterium andalusiense]